jgi:signal peptidase I
VRRALILVACVIGALVAAVPLLAGVGVLHLYRIPSSSMEPTLHCARPARGCLAAADDRVVVLRYVFGSPKRGDVIALHTPALAKTRCGAGGVYLKRVIGLPGEQFAEHGGFVYIDGHRLVEPYVKARDQQNVGAEKIPAGDYFVLGDNRAASCDSRAWGALPKGSVIGRVVATYWPTSRIEIR